MSDTKSIVDRVIMSDRQPEPYVEACDCVEAADCVPGPDRLDGKDRDQALDRDAAAPDDPQRREALQRMALYAAAVAPGMTVVMTGDAAAQRWGSRPPKKPECSNPGWRWGQRRRGHSGC